MQAKTEGIKPFEIRENDRGFQKGDTITYTSDRAPTLEYEGVFEITYVTGYKQQNNYVVFGDIKIKSN